MKLLYVLWRSTYTDTQVRTKEDDATKDECVFCIQTGTRTSEMKKKHQLLYYGNTSAPMMNKYPYNAGHMLAIPYAHKAQLHLLADPEHTELFDVVSKATHVAQETLKANGVNIGLNLGKAAETDIPRHLHVHIIPRWARDTNSLVTSACTKTISHNLHKIYLQLCDAYTHS